MHEQLLRFSINSQFRLHYAVQHELEKPLGLLWLFRPSTAHITIRYTTTSITFKHVVEKLEQSWATVYTEYCQNRGQKKPAGKNPNRGKNSAGNLSRTRGSCSEKPILRRLHGWKVFALIYHTCIPTKHGKLQIVLGNPNKLRNSCETRTVTSKSNMY